MTDLRTWEDELRSQGKEPKPGPRYRCPQDDCERAENAFAIVLDPTDDEWKCSVCYNAQRAEEQGEPERTWEDVRGVRRVFLEASDWTQLPDVPEATRAAWVGLRQQARDVTDLPTPQEALDRLAALREQGSTI